MEGQVTDATGTATTQGTVIVFADEPGKWLENSGYVRAARPDQKGRYEIKGMPPGEYLGVALDYVPDRIWNDPDYLEAIRRYAQRVRIGDGDTQAISLKMVNP